MNSKITETLTLENGYKGIFCQADGPENPLKEDYGNPPTLTRFWDRHGWSKWEGNGSDLDWQDIYALIPDDKFNPENLQATLDRIGADDLPPLSDIEEDCVQWGVSMRDALRDAIRESDLPGCSSYRSENGGIAFLETLASLAGIPYLASQSNGYCQGDHAEIFSAITPAWIAATGCRPEYFDSAMKEAARQYAAWAWGNVWYLRELVRPDGTEVEFPEYGYDCYGDPDDKESGCLECLKESAASDAASHAKETAEAEAWAARDTVTLPA